MRLSRPLICSVVATLICLSFVTNAEATELTKEEKARQLAEREKALAEIRASKQNNIASNHVSRASFNVITLEISKACKMINTTSCPKFSDLVSYDTTNQKYIGKFVDDKRLKSLLKYPSVYYRDAKDTVVCVDCPWDIYKNSKHVIIDRPFVYKNNDDRTIVNNTRYEYHNRYVEDCSYARTTFDLLNDTINYLKSGCTKTDYDEKVSIYMPLVKHDISSSVAYKYKMWLEEAKKLKTENCLKSDKC